MKLDVSGMLPCTPNMAKERLEERLLKFKLRLSGEGPSEARTFAEIETGLHSISVERRPLAAGDADGEFTCCGMRIEGSHRIAPGCLRGANKYGTKALMPTVAISLGIAGH
jgi:hypothetical protein